MGICRQSEEGAPLVALTYETTAEAGDARNLMAKVVVASSPRIAMALSPFRRGIIPRPGLLSAPSAAFLKK
jgi:hypothetical protein